MVEQQAPGTTFRKHDEIARGLLSEDDFLLSEILTSPYSLEQVERVRDKLNDLIGLIRSEDSAAFRELFAELRANIGANPVE